MNKEVKKFLECSSNYDVIDYIANLQHNLEVSQTNEETYRLEMQEITKIFGLDKHTLFDDVKEYATNLQQDLDKANDIIEKDRQFYKCRMDEYAKLKKENKILRENAEHNDKVVDKARWNEMIYKSRCEKALEYINFAINHYKEQLETPIEDTYFNSDVNRKGYILSIITYLQTTLDTLNGSDENE